MSRILSCIILLIIPFSVFAQGEPAVSYDDISKFLAGQRVSAASPLNGLMNVPSVRKHYNETQALSNEWENLRLKQIRQWAKTEIQPRISRPGTVKYMFGGPDFVHVESIFPGAPEYILVGLEPLGTVPDFFSMNEAQWDSYLSHLNYTLRSISRRNFFITTEMREDFGKQGVDGVFPVLLYFAALTGHQVLDANYVSLGSNGQASQTGSAANSDGIWLRLRDTKPGSPPEQNLYYFKTDLSNGGFKGGSKFHSFLSGRPGGVAYLKAASYLMHTDDFSNIRNFLVGDCQFVLQDASGMAADFFALYYDVTYYGNYVGPIDMFSEYDQPNLRAIYQSGVARPLPFGTGYRMKDEHSIQMFGVRK